MKSAIKRMLTGDGDSSEAEALLHVKDVFDQVCRGKDNGVRNETVLMPLDGADHCGLRGGGLVVVDDANAAEELQRKRGASDTWSRSAR